MRKILGKIKNASKAKEYRRKLSIRKKVVGTVERPRICATKSNKNLFVQVVDDSTNKTIFSVQTFGKNGLKATANVAGAKLVGLEVAKIMKEKNISNAVFDRNGKKYTGVITALADSIREGGVHI
jgi:large subunit ribosomal protein L18